MSNSERFFINASNGNTYYKIECYAAVACDELELVKVTSLVIEFRYWKQSGLVFRRNKNNSSNLPRMALSTSKEENLTKN